MRKEVLGGLGRERSLNTRGEEIYFRPLLACHRRRREERDVLDMAYY
jgi:hypothetical protein